MSKEVEFPIGIFMKAPHENAPEFVKASASIKLSEAIPWLQAKAGAGEEWVNLDVKESQSGKWYASVNNWKPNSNGFTGAPIAAIEDDDMPF